LWLGAGPGSGLVAVLPVAALRVLVARVVGTGLSVTLFVFAAGLVVHVAVRGVVLVGTVRRLGVVTLRIVVLALVVEVVVDHLVGVGGVLEGVGLHSVREREFGRAAHVAFDDSRPAVKCREGPCDSRGRDVGAVPIDARLPAQFRDLAFELRGQFHIGKCLACGREPRGRVEFAALVVAPGFAGAAVRAERAVDDRHAVLDVVTAGDGRLQSEPVPELWAEVPLLWVHRPDEGHVGRMRDAQSVAFDAVDAAGGRVQKHVHQMVVEEIHLVDVEDSPIGSGEQSRLELLRAIEGIFDRERPDDTVAGRTER
jgi:hypothetical protein